MANYSKFIPVEGESANADHGYREEMRAMNLSKLVAPKHETPTQRLLLPDDQAFWDTLEDPELYFRLRTDATWTQIRQDYADRLYNAHPDDPNEIDSGYRMHFWADLDIDPIGRPINPYGPTGYGDRGQLWQWGPRQATDTLVVAEHEGHDYFLMLNKKGKLAFPGGFANPENREWVMDSHVREVFQETEQTIDLFAEQGDAITSEIPVSNQRMTDNAWVESNGAFFLYTGEITLEAINTVDGDGAHEIETSFQWVPLSAENVEMVSKSPQRALIFSVAQEMGYIRLDEAD